MKLGEKILKLREENNITIENLSNQIGVKEQTIYKWEDGKESPDIKELIKLSDLFKVSVDYLIKDNQYIDILDGGKYLVSKEEWTGYIVNEKRVSFLIGFSFMLLSFTGIPYTLFSYNSIISYLGMVICVTLGISIFILGMYSEKEQYKILKQVPLLLEQEHIKELSEEYSMKKRVYNAIGIPSLVLFIMGLLILGLTVHRWSEYHSIIFGGFGMGLLGIIYSSNASDAYRLFLQNEQYSTSLSFKLRQKIREKIKKYK